jgi:mono/diheme cytochrome c family protein
MKLLHPGAKLNLLLLSSLGSALGIVSLGSGGMKAQPAPQTQPLIYSIKGPDLYREYCAVCHGTTGHGDGPVASKLKTKVPDLTILAKNNKGQFPSAIVRKTIEGTESATSHGTREMPIWGPIFHQVEDDKDFGYVRVDNLLKYLESIQQE